jgi:hypothetical protein
MAYTHIEAGPSFMPITIGEEAESKEHLTTQKVNVHLFPCPYTSPCTTSTFTATKGVCQGPTRRVDNPAMYLSTFSASLGALSLASYMEVSMVASKASELRVWDLDVSNTRKTC